jgi:hypothetical protein
VSEFGMCDRCDEGATAYMLCADGSYRDLCPAHEAEEERAAEERAARAEGGR